MIILLALSVLGSKSVLLFFNLTKVNETLFLVSRFCFWILLLLLILYTTKIEKQKFLLWPDKRYTSLQYLLSVLAVFAAFFVSMLIGQLLLSLFVPKEKSVSMLELLNLFRNNKFLLVFTCLTAGVCEELIFRGYILPRLQLIFKNTTAAVVVSSLLFGLLHYRYGTLANMFGPFFIGLVSALYYWKYRNIKVLILCHFLWDLMAILILLKQ
ncbi:MAG: CPBP family intramembrane glutamic endopeptidase [Ferruginibacter sp.]